MMKKYLHILFILCLVHGFLSCSKTEVAQMGSFELSIASEVRLDEAVKSPEALPEEECADYTIMLFKEGTLIWETSYAEFTADTDNSYKRVPAGEYEIYVENCTADEAEEGFGMPRYAGRTTFNVTAGRTTVAQVVCTQANAKVTMAYSPDFGQYLMPFGLSVSDGQGRKLALDMEKISESHDLAEIMYFNVSEEGKALLTYTLVAGNLTTDDVMRYDIAFTVEKCKWNKVTMTPKTETGQ